MFFFADVGRTFTGTASKKNSATTNRLVSVFKQNALYLLIKFPNGQSANYNHEDDEYLAKKSGNGFLDVGKLENNNLSGPICIQPSSARSNPKTPNIRSAISAKKIIFICITHLSSIHIHSAGKIHEDDYRQIQTNAPILAPEIMSVFANSQIFHEHHAKKTSYPGVHGRGGREADSEKLLFRLEGNRK